MSGNHTIQDVAVTWPECGHTAGICCKQCFDEQAERVGEMQALFDLQHTRSVVADKRWQEAHPDEKDTWPDFGRLLEWMLGKMDEQAAELIALKTLEGFCLNDLVKRWYEAHTDQKGLHPPLGELVRWLLGEMDRQAAELNRLEAARDRIRREHGEGGPFTVS